MLGSLAGRVVAFTGNLHLVCTCIAAEIAAKLFACRHCAQAGFVGANVFLFISHRILLQGLLESIGDCRPTSRTFPFQCSSSPPNSASTPRFVRGHLLPAWQSGEPVP